MDFVEYDYTGHLPTCFEWFLSQVLLHICNVNDAVPSVGGKANRHVLYFLKYIYQRLVMHFYSLGLVCPLVCLCFGFGGGFFIFRVLFRKYRVFDILFFHHVISFAKVTPRYLASSTSDRDLE